MNASYTALALALCVGTVAARADFTVSPPLMHSAGSLGNAGNSVYLYTYSGPDTIVGSSSFLGGCSGIAPGTTAAEARWNVRNTRFGTSGSVSFQVTLTGVMSGTVLIAGTPGGGMILRSGDVLQIETFDAFDDAPGDDAIWTSVHWTFSTASIKDLGSFAAVTSMRTTGGVGFGTDTEIALYDSAGLLLRTNDDFAGTSGSGFTGLALADGTYYLAVTPYDSTFANGLARPGIDGTGAFTLGFNGTTVDSATLGTRTTLWYRFTVGTAIPCPADFDGDGTADFFDYDAFVACFEGGSCPSGKTADFDGDGSVDFFDYDAYVVAFELGC